MLAIAWVTHMVAFIVVSIVCTTMLLQMVSSFCKACSFGRIKVLAFLLLGLLCTAINYCLVQQLKSGKRSNQNSIHDLLTSLVSSVIIGIYGYILKKLLYQKKKDGNRTEGDNMESNPLIQPAQSIP